MSIDPTDRLIKDLSDGRPHDPDWRLPTGFTLSEFRLLIPGLLTFGGAKYEEMLAGWEQKTTWDGCPMNRGYGLSETDNEMPPRIDRLMWDFIALFDFGYLDPPPTEGEITVAESRKLLLEHLYGASPEPESAPGDERQAAGASLVVDG